MRYAVTTAAILVALALAGAGAAQNVKTFRSPNAKFAPMPGPTAYKQGAGSTRAQ